MKSGISLFDRFLFNVLFGMVFPILCFLIFWFSSVLITNDENIIMISALSGLSLGIFISIFIRMVRRFDVFKLSNPILLLVYLFYNIGLFGFFMGVPIFHPVLGVIAGYYWIKRLIYNNDLTNFKSEVERISKFTSIVIGIVCVFSAAIALINESTPSELENMFHLPFEISQPLLIAFIITGGLFLISVQYWLTKITMKKMLL